MEEQILASIEKIESVKQHPNADRLDIIKVAGYQCIVGRDEYRVDDLVVLIRPDSVLPDEEWAIPYKKFCKNRVKAQKLRGEWSFGIAINPKSVGIIILHEEYEVGKDVTEFLNISKYEYPNQSLIQELNIRRPNLPHNLPKTDEQNWQGLHRILNNYLGQTVDITEKIDGQSCTIYYKNGDFGVCSRKNDYKLDANNTFTQHIERYDLYNKIVGFCKKHNVNLALRGESYGTGIQAFKINKWAKKSHGLAFFSVFNLDTLEYERRDSPFYIHKIAKELGIETVPLLETNLVLSMDLIRYYRDLEKLNGEYFEGVVIQGKDFSFKIINFEYDSKK